MTVVLVHGFPETSRIWDPLRTVLDEESVALAMPGFAAPRPAGFTATKDAYAYWLADELRKIGQPIDLVGHDVGALISLRVATAGEVPLRSFAVDVAPIFHPDFAWTERVRGLQTPGVGEALMQAMREASPEDPESTSARLTAGGVPVDQARAMGAAHDETMSRSMLDFYRSAAPNVAADWWNDVAGPTPSHGLLFLLPDPPEEERMSLEVAQRLGAETARLPDLDHCWMAEAPEAVARVLQHFWSTLGR